MSTIARSAMAPSPTSNPRPSAVIREAAFACCQEKLAPRVLEANRHEIFHQEVMTEMGELGFLGPTIPERLGGAGASYVA